MPRSAKSQKCLFQWEWKQQGESTKRFSTKKQIKKYNVDESVDENNHKAIVFEREER